MGVHDGHRDRMRQRFFRFGLETFNEIEALEFLLYYAIPQRDTNPLAHALLERFGSLWDVLNASEQQLCELPGVGEKTAALLKLVPQLVRLSEIGQSERSGAFGCTDDAVTYLRPFFRGRRDEMALLACLDSANRVISTDVLNVGTANGVRVDIRQIVEIALKRKASTVLLAHNHPDGQIQPSREDDAMTAAVYQALQTVEIGFYDHIIIAGENYASYRRSGALDLYRYKY